MRIYEENTGYFVKERLLFNERVILEVVPSSFCKGCYFDNGSSNPGCVRKHMCSRSLCLDNQDISYKVIERINFYKAEERTYYPINTEILTLTGVKLRVLPNGNCYNCYYKEPCRLNTHSISRKHPECLSLSREDKTSVYFYEVK